MDQLVDVFLSALRMATPLWFAAMGGLLSERSGVINLGLEGYMLIGAFAAASVAHFSGMAWLGLAAGGMAGAWLAVVFAVLVLELKGDQVVLGMGINLFAVGLTPFLCKMFFDVTGSTPSLAPAERFSYELILVALAVVGILAFWYRSLLSGLWLQFAGEEPFALTASGISVKRLRWVFLLSSGCLAGLGGASLSIMLASQFTRLMTAGNGFIAIAALILGACYHPFVSKRGSPSRPSSMPFIARSPFPLYRTSSLVSSSVSTGPEGVRTATCRRSTCRWI